MHGDKLREVLRAARPSWSPSVLAAAEDKLWEVGVSDVGKLKEFLDAPTGSGLNQRLRDAGLKVFSPETLVALREELAKPGFASYLRKSQASLATPGSDAADPPAQLEADKAAQEGHAQLDKAFSPAEEEEHRRSPRANGAAAHAGSLATGFEAVAEGLPEEWSVTYSRVIFRGTPSTSGEVVGFAQWGQIVRGVIEDVGGTKWLRVRAGDVEGEVVGTDGVTQWEVVQPNTPVRQSKTLSSSVIRSKMKGALVFGKQDGKWVELRPGPGYMRISEGQETFLKAAADRPLWMLVDGASLGLGQLLTPVSSMQQAGPDEAGAPADEEPMRTPDFEVRRVPGRGLGLFAMRGFAAGEVVLGERPFWTRPQPDEVKKCKALFQPAWAEAFNAIKEPLPYPGQDAEVKIFASPAMVRNALGFAKTTAVTRKKILQLHCPDLDCGHPIVAVAGRVAALCIERLAECKGLDLVELQRAILCIEMNIFAGGRCFTTFSRLNHSCFPNAVYIAMNKKWCFKALRDISEGEEILHSYLGKELLLPTEIRRRLLWRSKCFECACERCTAGADAMRAIPCRWCRLEQASLTVVHQPGVWMRDAPMPYANKRCFVVQGNSLTVAGSTENMDWIRDDWIKVVHPEKGEGWVLTHGQSLNPALGALVVHNESKRGLLPDDPQASQCRSYWRGVVEFLASTESAGANILDDDFRDENAELLSEMLPENLWLPPYAFSTGEGGAPSRMMFQAGSWSCERCQRGPEHEDSLLGTERLLGRLAERTFFSPEMTPALGTFSGKSGGLKMVKQEFVLKAMDLAITVTGVLGRKHWSHCWAQILFADLLISRLQYPGVQRGATGAGYLLEILLDLWEWLGTLGLAQNPSCFLYGRVSEALRLVQHLEYQMDDHSKIRFYILRERLESSSLQIDILPLRPLIIDGTISFQ